MSYPARAEGLVNRTTPKFKEGRYSIPWIAPLYPWSLPYYAVLSKAASSKIFESLVWFDVGLNPGLPDHWRTLHSLGQWPIVITIKLIQLFSNPLHCPQIDTQTLWNYRIGGSVVNAKKYSVLFPIFWRYELCHVAAFLSDTRQLILICCTVDKIWNK